MPTILGEHLLGGPETLEKQGRKDCGKNSLTNLMRNMWPTFRKFGRPKIKTSPQICSDQPIAQSLFEIVSHKALTLVFLLISCGTAEVLKFQGGGVCEGASRKFVANCAPNLRNIAGAWLCASHEDSVKLLQIRK